MDLSKRANGLIYKFASQELINEFIVLCKEGGLESSDISEMLENMESSRIENQNKTYPEA